MNRSNNCVFLSHCLLAQAVRANGLAKYDPAAVKLVVTFCLDNDINMVQMPCPELLCDAGGLGRDPHGKKWYEKNGLREVSERIAGEQVVYMRTLLGRGFHVLAVIGMEFSPACAATYQNQGQRIKRDRGIFIEELTREMERAELSIPIIGIHPRWSKKLQRDLESLLPSVGALV